MNVADIPRVYTAIAEWSACIVYILVIKRRLKELKLIGTIPVALLLFCILQEVNGRLPITFWVPGMITAVCFMYIMIYISCEVSMIQAGAYCARAFVLAELCASLGWQVYLFFHDLGMEDALFEISCMLTIFLAMNVTVFYLEAKDSIVNDGLQISTREMFNSFLIAAAAFSMGNLGFVNLHTPFSTDVGTGILYTRTLVDFAGFAILFAQQDKWKELHMKQEMDSIQLTLHQQYDQYEKSCENIQILNQKYHDLKQQIHEIRQQTDPIKREAYLKAMESDIRMYEEQNKTKNSVLDTIMTCKSIYCQQHNINFTYVADGVLLAFIDEVDTCSIFGCLLDNAVECVCKFKNQEHRLIRVAVFAQNEFLMIRVENYTGKKQRIEEGNIVTSIQKKYKGYGLLSIQYIVEKYHGTMTIHNEYEWFIVRILIPLPKGL